MVGADTQPGDLIGQDLGPYRIIRRLGMGGMAETFEAVRQGPSGFSRRVCLKLVRPGLRGDGQSLKLFEREARLAAKLHHSNIVSILDFGEIGATLYMSLELIDGVDLQALLASRRKLSHDLVALIGYELALALEHAHDPPGGKQREGRADEGILHRDVSPSNVLISRNGEIKLTDFGLANIASRGTPLSTVKGKFPYMPPERLRDESIDQSSDLFALGVIMYEALAGRRPYDGGHDPATIMLIIDGEHRPLSEVAPDVPEGLSAIIESLIDPDPSKRPATASVLARQLEEFVPAPSARRRLGKMVVATPGYMPLSESSGSDPRAASSATLSAPTPIPSSKRHFDRFAAMLLLAFGAVAGAYALWPGSGGEAPKISGDTESMVVPVAPERTRVPAPGKSAADASVAEASQRKPPAVQSPPESPALGAKPPATARLTVLVSPWGNVWINGRDRGSAPLKKAALKPGRYKVSAGQGKPSKSQTLRLRAGQRKTVRFDLAE